MRLKQLRPDASLSQLLNIVGWVFKLFLVGRALCLFSLLSPPPPVSFFWGGRKFKGCHLVAEDGESALRRSRECGCACFLIPSFFSCAFLFSLHYFFPIRTARSLSSLFIPARSFPILYLLIRSLQTFDEKLLPPSTLAPTLGLGPLQTCLCANEVGKNGAFVI